ncbi:MAG: SAM-dependent methyltransferase [Euryarchaeota archaeon]|nr:SAM-dependent methyltransferase [Euryarchaeota archaeon]
MPHNREGGADARSNSRDARAVPRTAKKRRGTKTSSFGVSKRESHDSSEFYGSTLYNGLPKESDTGKVNAFPKDKENRVFCGDSRNMHQIPDNSVHLMITSPPYNVTKTYDDDLALSEYLELLRSVFDECYRVLVPGGRACINVANLGRKPYIPLSSFINQIMIEIGFLPRGEIIWNKSASAGVSCAWGSWKSASNPTLRDVHEYILVFSKGKFKLHRSRAEKEEGRQDTVGKEDFIEWTKSIWTFPTVSAKRVGHPAPFPVELPRRCIEMYSFAGDVILDPFAGSGSTGIAAKQNNRKYLLFDISKEYCDLAEMRISET